MTHKENINSIKNVVFDLDGTLLNSNRFISEKNKESLHYLYKKKVNIIFASARLKRDVDLVVPDIFHKCLKVCSNGAITYLGNEKLFENKLTKTQINHIIQSIVKIDYLNPICFQTEDDFYCSQDLTSIDPYIRFQQISLNNIPFYDCALIAVSINNKLSLEKLKSLLPDSCESTSNEDGTIAHIHKKGISKKAALIEFSKQNNFEFSRTLAFGDSYNDLELLKAVGFGVCMANSCDFMKEQIKYKTKSNNDDGVHYFIQNLIDKRLL